MLFAIAFPSLPWSAVYWVLALSFGGTVVTGWFGFSSWTGWIVAVIVWLPAVAFQFLVGGFAAIATSGLDGTQ